MSPALQRTRPRLIDYQFVNLRTDAAGEFSHALTLTQATEFSAYYPYNNDLPGYLGGNSGTLLVGVTKSATRVTTRLSSTRVNAGEAITVSGKARWKSPEGWRPLTGTQLIMVIDYPFSSSEPQRVTPDADGRYTLTTVPYTSGVVTVRHWSEDPFKADATATRDVAVVHPSAIRESSAS